MTRKLASNLQIRTLPVLQRRVVVDFGRRGRRVADMSVLRTQELQEELHTFPERAVSPQVGDTVVAVGLPNMDVIQGGWREVAARLEEGMFVSFGTVAALHSSGRDRYNQTPVFEVEAHWPSGMSGGPVFNRDGHVVGIVNCTLEDSGDFAGSGRAAWLDRLPEHANAARSAHALNQ